MNTHKITKHRHTGFIVVALSWLLSLPLGAFAQATATPAPAPTPYYLAGGLTDFSDQMLRQSNPVYVTMDGNMDSMIISASPDEYKYASFYKHTPGEPFMRRTQAWGTSMPNFAFVFTEGFVLVEEGGSYLAFVKDPKLAKQTLDAGGIRKQDIDGMREKVVTINNRVSAEDGKVASAKYKKIATAYIRKLHSRMNDPKLISDIKKWSNNPTTTVCIPEASYSIGRNALGAVLDKTVMAFIKYHKDGKCYIMWGTFGYESLGGGRFSKDMTTFVSTYQYINVPGVGEMRLDPGEAQEVECD